MLSPQRLPLARARGRRRALSRRPTMEELAAFVIENERGAERAPDGWESVVFVVGDEEEPWVADTPE